MNKVKLGDVLEYEQPTKYIVSSTQYKDEFDTPVLTAGKSFILGYTDEIDNIFTNVPVIIFDDFTTAIKFVDFPFKVKSSAMKILKPNKSIADVRYLFYLMMTFNINSKEHKRYWISKYSQIEIPLPPLSEQKRIAAILDEADQIRQFNKQLIEKYNQLSQSLFLDMFGDPVTNPMGWGKVKLENLVSKLGDGLHGTPKYSDDGSYYFINGNNLIDGKIKISNKTKRIDEQEYNKIKKDLNESSVLVSINGTIGKIAFYNNEPVALGKSACYFNVIESLLNKKYLYYIFTSGYFINYTMGNVTGSTIKNVSLKSMRNFPITIPPLELQNKFAQRIEEIEKQKAQAEASLQKSEALFGALLQRAFRGDLT